MTDAQINRLVTERVLDWKPVQMGHAGEMWQRPDGALRSLPDFCRKPEAWGMLYQWLIAAGRAPCLDTTRTQMTTAEVLIPKDGCRAWASVDDTGPGRALALATLQAFGITETQHEGD